MIEYVCSVTIDGDSINNPLVGGEIICTIARASLYDIAVNLIQQNRHLAILKDESGCCALEVIAERPRMHSQVQLSCDLGKGSSTHVGH
ncbi:hypothetical protein MKX03_035393 [Papaver bracteatum]|nr:hypothetical protein MKX03_035393 [Papaver bracteatum]